MDAIDRAFEQQLRGVSDGLLQAVRAVAAREAQKRGVPPSDSRFPELAAAVRQAAEELLQLASEEEQAAHRTHQRPGIKTIPPIDEVEPRADLAEILAEWRAVERELESADAGSPEALALLVRYEAIRDEYQRAIESRLPAEPE